MKETFSMKFIKVLLIIVMVICICGFWKYSLITLFTPNKLTDSISDTIIFLFDIAIYIIIAWNLFKIVISIDSSPFCLKNVRSFKLIGYLMILLSFIDGIVKFKKSNDFAVIGIEINNGIVGIRSSCIVYLVLGFMALILGEIFKKAVKIKDENDLTI